MTETDTDPRRLVAGLGCTSAARADEVIALVREAMAQVSGELVALATIPRRADHPALREAAARLNLPLRVIELPGPDVAEPVAASAGPLVLGKQKSAEVTCALALAPLGFDLSRWGQPSSNAAMASSTVATSKAGP